MKKTIALVLGFSLLASLPLTATADPEAEREAFVNHFKKKFPNIALEDYVNGVYALDAGAREQ